MPMKQTKSGLAGKLGSKLNKAVEETKDNPTDYGIIQLPGGIRNGVAQLKKAYAKQYENGDNKGEYFVRLEGTVITPKSIKVDGVDTTVAGLYTSCQFPICDTKNAKGEVTTLKEHVDELLNAMRMLGVDTSDASGDNLEAMLAALQESKPFFKFSTSQGKATEQYPDPRVWENWHGSKGLEDFVAPEGDDVTDETNADESGEGGGDDEKEAPSDSDDDWEKELAEALEKATSGESDSELIAMAKEAGKTAKEVKEADSWEEVAGWIREFKEGSGEGQEEEEFKPVKGGTYKFKNPKTKKLIEIDVDKIDTKAKTVDAHATDDKKLKFPGIAWDDLIVE